MYRFSRGRTKPQALLMLSSLMMFIVVAINIFVYLLIPQYSIYGDQFYISVRPVCINYLSKLKSNLSLLHFSIIDLQLKPARNT